MGARFQQTFYSEKQGVIGVTIDDSSFSGTSQGFSLTSLEIAWRGDDGKERFSPIIGSECKFGMIINTSDLETFITDLITAQEGRFTVTVGTSNGITPETRWVGYITTDLTSIEDVPLSVGYVANITCVDGLGVLKGVQYSQTLTSPHTGKETFIEHILRCLNNLAFVNLYYGSNLLTLLKTACNWHETSWTYSSTKDPLANSRVSHSAFYHIDNKGNYKFKTCYEVLEAICTAWGARIVFSGDCFWFIQVNQMASPTAVNVVQYKSDGTATTGSNQDLRLENDQLNLTSSDLQRFSGGFFQFFAPLEKVTVDYNHIQSRNTLPGVNFKDGSPVSYTSVDTVDSGLATTRLNYSGQMRMTTDWQALTFQNFFVQFRIQVNVGSYYLNGGISGTSPEWTVINTDWFYVLSPIVVVEENTEVFSISFLTPPLPLGASGTVTFKPAIYKAFDMAGNELVIAPTLGDVDVSWELFNNYLEVLEDGTFDDQSDIFRFSATNDASASKTVQLSTVLGDGPNTVTPGHIEIYNDTTTTWVNSDAWRVGNSGTAKAFSQLLINEIIKGQLTPVKRLTGFSYQNLNPPYKPLQPHNVIYWDSGNYVCQNMSWDLKRDIFSGDWFKLQSAAGYTEQAIQYLPENSDSGVPTTSGGGSAASGGGGGTSTGGSGGTQPAVQSVNVYSQEFLDTTSNALTVTQNSGVLPGNEAYIKVYQNGQKLLQSQWSASGSVVTIDSTTHYDGSNYEIEFIIIG